MPEATKPAPDAQSLVGASEAAEIMKIELSTFSHLRRREESSEGSKFPKPTAVLRCGPIWKTADIQRFAKKYVAPRPGPKPALDGKVAAKPAAAKRIAKPVKAAAKVAVKDVPVTNGTVTPINGKQIVKKAIAKKAVAKKAVAKKVSATV